MISVGVHVIWYTAVNALIVATWLLTTGSLSTLADVAAHPSDANRLGFWPVWPILGWGTLVIIHALSWLLLVVTGRRGPLRAWRERRAGADPLGPAGPPALAGSPLTVPSPPGPARAWVAVLFSDIVGSTRLNEQLGDEQWSRLLVDHRRLVRRLVADHGGAEVGTAGDGCLARFEQPGDAVACAVALQEATQADGLVRVRIGVHAGEAVHDDGDLVGRVVNVAARVTEAAEPGEILVTEAIAEHVGEAVAFEDRGVRALKGIAQPRHLLAAMWRTGPGGGR